MQSAGEMSLMFTLTVALLYGCAGVSGTTSTSTGSVSSVENSGSAGGGGSNSSASTVQWQALANQATKAMGVGPVYVDERPDTRSLYYCREMRIQLGAKRSDVRLSLAHELAHHVLRHCGESVAHEMEANALAVKILEVWGETPHNAARLMVLKVYRSRNAAFVSVHDACAELRDLLARYPNVPDPRKPGECGATSTTEVPKG